MPTTKSFPSCVSTRQPTATRRRSLCLVLLAALSSAAFAHDPDTDARQLAAPSSDAYEAIRATAQAHLGSVLDAASVRWADGRSQRIDDIRTVADLTTYFALVATREGDPAVLALARDWLLALAHRDPADATQATANRLLVDLTIASSLLAPHLDAGDNDRIRDGLARHAQHVAQARGDASDSWIDTTAAAAAARFATTPDDADTMPAFDAAALDTLPARLAWHLPLAAALEHALGIATDVHADGFEAPPEVLCAQAAAGQAWLQTPLASQTGDFTVAFDIVPSAGSMDAVVGLAHGATDAFAGIAAAVKLDESGVFSVRNGSAYVLSDLAYAAGERYRVRFDVYLRPRVYTVSVTPANGSERVIATQFAFRSEQAAVSTLDHRIATVAGASGALQVCAPDVAAASATHVRYGYIPPVQYTGGGAVPEPVPAGFIHQTAWDAQGTIPDVRGVYTHDFGNWRSLVWRWADTMRIDAITTLDQGPATTAPVYRFELTPDDHSSPGTVGDRPRAEFFSVDGHEDKPTRVRQPPRENIIRDGDEYWATFSLYLAEDFPLNHKWATLFQRKFQNGTHHPDTWFSIDAHNDKLEYTLPRFPTGTYRTIGRLSELRGRWLQFTLHEKASSGSDGFFELYLDGELLGRKDGATIHPGDTNYNFHFGYYRENAIDEGDEEFPPGIGVLYKTPLLILRGPNPGGIATVPALP